MARGSLFFHSVPILSHGLSAATVGGPRGRPPGPAPGGAGSGPVPRGRPHVGNGAPTLGRAASGGIPCPPCSRLSKGRQGAASLRLEGGSRQLPPSRGTSGRSGQLPGGGGGPGWRARGPKAGGRLGALIRPPEKPGPAQPEGKPPGAAPGRELGAPPSRSGKRGPPHGPQLIFVTSYIFGPRAVVGTPWGASWRHQAVLGPPPYPRGVPMHPETILGHPRPLTRWGPGPKASRIG